MKHHSVADEKHPLRVACGAGGMGHHQDGLPLTVHLIKQPEQAIGGLAVERAGWLISQNNLRVGNQCPRYRRVNLITAFARLRRKWQKKEASAIAG